MTNRQVSKKHPERAASEQHEFARAQVNTNRTILGTFITAGISIWQAYISRIAANAARDAVATAEQARKDAKEASDDSSRSSNRALQATIDQFRQDQRPYIAETKGSASKPIMRRVDGATDGSVQIVWNYGTTNYGKSPANNITTIEQMKLLGGNWTANAKNTNPISHGAPLAPTLDSMDSIFSRPLSQQEATRLLQIQDGVEIRVRIIYEDVSSGRYETGICYLSSGQNLTAFCTHDNYLH